MSYHTSRREVLGAVAGGAALGVAGCTGNGGGDDRLLIPGLYDLSGGTSDVGEPAANGSIDMWQYINDEGLTDPIEVNHDWVDYAYEVDEAVRAYDDFAPRDPPCIIGWGTADTEALAPDVAEDEIVYISASYSERLMQPETPYNFFVNLDYTSQARVHLEWIADNDPGSTVSFIFSDNPFGRSPVEGGEDYAEELGLEVGPRLELALGAASAESQLRRAREDNVDYLIHQNTSAPMDVLVADRPEVYPDVEIMGLTYTLDELRVEQSPSRYEGVRYSGAFRTFDEALEAERGGDVLEELFDRYRDEDLDDREVANLNYVRGMLHTLVAYQALSNAQDDEDLDPFVGSDFREGMFQIDEWDGWGLIEPISYAEEDRRPTMTGHVWEVQDGEMVRDDTYELPRREEWIQG